MFCIVIAATDIIAIDGCSTAIVGSSTPTGGGIPFGDETPIGDGTSTSGGTPAGILVAGGTSVTAESDAVVDVGV